MRNGIQNRIRSFWIIGMFLLVGGSAEQSRAFDVSLLGGTTLGSISSVSQVATSGSFAFSYGFGGLMGYDFFPGIGLETGIFYAQHTTTLTGVGGSSVNGSLSLNGSTIPILLRLHLIPFLAFELGGYVGISNTGTLTTDLTPAAAVSVINDNGLLGGISFYIPLAPTFKIRVAGFYEFGLANVTQAVTAQNSQNINIYGGFNIGF